MASTILAVGKDRVSFLPFERDAQGDAFAAGDASFYTNLIDDLAPGETIGDPTFIHDDDAITLFDLRSHGRHRALMQPASRRTRSFDPNGPPRIGPSWAGGTRPLSSCHGRPRRPPDAVLLGRRERDREARAYRDRNGPARHRDGRSRSHPSLRVKGGRDVVTGCTSERPPCFSLPTKVSAYIFENVDRARSAHPRAGHPLCCGWRRSLARAASSSDLPRSADDATAGRVRRRECIRRPTVAASRSATTAALGTRHPRRRPIAASSIPRLAEQTPRKESQASFYVPQRQSPAPDGASLPTTCAGSGLAAAHGFAARSASNFKHGVAQTTRGVHQQGACDVRCVRGGKTASRRRTSASASTPRIRRSAQTLVQRMRGRNRPGRSQSDVRDRAVSALSTTQPKCLHVVCVSSRSQLAVHAQAMTSTGCFDGTYR